MKMAKALRIDPLFRDACRLPSTPVSPMTFPTVWNYLPKSSHTHPYQSPPPDTYYYRSLTRRPIRVDDNPRGKPSSIPSAPPCVRPRELRQTYLDIVLAALASLVLCKLFCHAHPQNMHACSTRKKSKRLGGTVSFENSLGVAPGGIHVRHTSWGALHDVQQRCNVFGAGLHACSTTKKNQRAWVEE